MHDAVRPFIDLETIHKVFDEAAETGAAIVAVPAVDTVKQVTRGTTHVRIRATLPREKLVMAQTPQVFLNLVESRKRSRALTWGRGG